MPSRTQPTGVPVSAVVANFDLEVMTDAGVDLTQRMITSAQVNRPGLQWAGYSERFPTDRIQLIGGAEVGYLLTLPDDVLWTRLEQYCQLGFPAVVVSRGIQLDDRVTELADAYQIPLLRTPLPTTDFAGHLNWFLAMELAPRVLLHAGLIDVSGEGVLILGPSGIGKSETALELIRRRHRLIADDTVEVRRPSSYDLIGRAPGRMRYFMEVKGIGIVNLRLMYGVGSVKAYGDISLVVQLAHLDPGRDFSAEPDRMEILDVNVPMVTIPVRPGRNTAMLIETAAANVRARRMSSREHPRAPGTELGDARSDLLGSLR